MLALAGLESMAKKPVHMRLTVCHRIGQGFPVAAQAGNGGGQGAAGAVVTMGQPLPLPLLLALGGEQVIGHLVGVVVGAGYQGGSSAGSDECFATGLDPLLAGERFRLGQVGRHDFTTGGQLLQHHLSE